MTQELRCPRCHWASRIEYLARTNEYICRHCGEKWPKKD